MKRIFYTIFVLLNSFCFSMLANAAFSGPCPDGQVPGENGCIAGSADNILGISKERLRTGNITYTDIPLMIVSAIEFLLGVAGSISVVALIYHAVRMQLASGITGDASGVDKAKKGMYGAMFGFVLSMSGWFLMTKFVALLSGSV